MRFHDSTVIQLENASLLPNFTTLMVVNMRMCANLRNGIMDMCFNVSPYLDAPSGRDGSITLLKRMLENRSIFDNSSETWREIVP